MTTTPATTGELPGADRITVLRVHLAGHPPGRVVFYLCRASLAARLAADTAASADEVTDLGPAALPAAGDADPEASGGASWWRPGSRRAAGG